MKRTKPMWKVPNEWYRQCMLKEEWAHFKVEWSFQSPGKLLKMADATVSPQLNQNLMGRGQLLVIFKSCPADFKLKK